MREVAQDVWQLDGWPPNLVNVYLVGDVLVDAGVKRDARRILRELRGRPVTAHLLTHAHPDHLGSSHAVCEQRALPFWVSEADAPAAADPAVMLSRLQERFAAVPLPLEPVVKLFVEAQASDGHPVTRTLQEGEEVCGFTVLDTPGHTAGHISLWRERDRVLIAGDVLWNFQFLAGRPGMTQPAPTSSADPALNRDAARRLAALEPATVGFGHGPVLRDGHRFVEFVERLPL